jgi:hypothetical protein
VAAKAISVELIRESIRSNQYEMSYHTERERGVEKITNAEIEEVLLKGEIIEDYPDDLRGPSCLVLGWIRRKVPLHIVCGLSPSGWLRIITLYIPLEDKWEDSFRKRKR